MKKPYIIAGAAVLIVAIIIGIVITLLLVNHNHQDLGTASSANSQTSTPSSQTVTGTLSLHDPDSFGGLQNGASCTGSNGYDDITQGAQVTASDNTGAILAVSASGLSAGKADGSGNCVFTFTIDNVPYSGLYQFQVTHRGQLAYSYQQLSSNNFQVSMTLGN